MKKKYFIPTMEIYELETSNPLLEGSKPNEPNLEEQTYDFDEDEEYDGELG